VLEDRRLVKFANEVRTLVLVWQVEHDGWHEHWVYIELGQQIAVTGSVNPHVIYGEVLGVILKCLQCIKILLMILSLIFLHLVTTEECNGAPLLFVQAVLPELLAGGNLLEFAVRATTAATLLELLLLT
jgi:hypothetical protein